MILEIFATQRFKSKISPDILFAVQNEIPGNSNFIGQKYSMWTLRDIETELDSEVSELALWKDQQNEVQAFVFYQRLPMADDAQEIWILHWAVKHKGQGLGVKLFREFVDRFKTQTLIKQIGLDVNSKNDSAIKIYNHLGFSQVQERKNYYKDGGDAWVMLLNLNSKVS